MAVKLVNELIGAEKGKDIFIIGSGRSLDFLPDNFFDGRVVLGVNGAYQHHPVKYNICHHHQVVQDMINQSKDRKFKVITSEFWTCVIHSHLEGWRGYPYSHDETLTGDYYIYKHLNQTYTVIDLSVWDMPDYLVAGGTIVTTAIQFAYRLGARAIWLAGCDGGAIDGEWNRLEYKLKTNPDHFYHTQDQLRIMANKVRSCGVPVVSVNPFIDFGLEGHKFTFTWPPEQ